jgi:hypothetical protein
MKLSADGLARVEVYLANEASPAEQTAARELVEYLTKVTGAQFEFRPESEDGGRAPAILVGPTAAARALEGPTDVPGEEEWIVRTVGDRLLLFGGRPRGTLYAVYEFLERHVGVRWWTPYEETVPFRPDLELPILDERGAPAFAYRDISLADISGVFAARSRLNGHFGRVPPSFGGARTYGPPNHVHTFYFYVPPEELLDEHPEYFSEIGGLRYGGEAQLCLTHPELPALVAARMARRIEEARREAADHGASLPTLFSFSQNDWARPCECEHCRSLVEREGSESGPVIEFVNELARRLAREDFDLWIDTLAYQYTLDAPSRLRTEPNVIVRVTGLHHRDFALPASHPSNSRYAAVVKAWIDRTDHLWVWDYSVVFGDFGDFPIPSLRALAEDYAWYLDQGVEGIYLQADYPIAADLRDLKLWVAAKLLSDPLRDYDALVEQFTSGYYGQAGRPIERYLEVLERAARRTPSRIGYVPEPEDYRYFDRKFFRAAHRLFDRAERKVTGDEILLRRVRHARLSLDRATLVFWPTAGRVGVGGMDTVAERYRGTWRDQMALRSSEDQWQAVLDEVDREIRYWSHKHAD